MGGDGGRHEREEFVDSVVVAPSERVVVDVLFEQAGEVTLEHRTPARTYALATIDVNDDPAAPSLTEQFETLRRNPEYAAERERLKAYVDAQPDKTLALVAELTVGENPVWFNGAVPATQPVPTVSNVQPSSGTIVGGQPVTFTWSATGNVATQSIVLEDRIPTLLNSTRDEPFNPDRLSHGFTVVSNLPGNVRSYTWTPPASMQWTDRTVRVAVVDTQ